jgi:hypothetical protein
MDARDKQALGKRRSCGRSRASFYNEIRTHQGKYCFGKTPMQTFLDARQLAHDKQIGGQQLHHQAA